MGKRTSGLTIKLLFVLLIGWGLNVAPILVDADGDSRPATKQEKDFYKSVKTTLAKAVPAVPPTGWDEEIRTVIEELTSIGIGEGIGQDQPLRIEYYVAWHDTKRKEAANQGAQEALSQQFEAEQAQPEGAELDKLNKQYEKLADELGKAIEAGNMDKAMKIQAEMEKVAAKMNPIYEHNDMDRDGLLEKEAPHDVEAGVFVAANSFSEDFYSPVKREAPMAGGLVYRSEGKFTPERGWREGYTYVFLGGNWKFRQDGGHGGMVAAVNKGHSHLAVQTIVVRIQADQTRARELMKKIDWSLLKKQIKN